MSYLNKSFIDFFKELSTNNSTEWFAEHRKEYEANVKEPFKALVEDMIKRIQKHQPEVQIKASDAIFRINKDIRFSKDKTPYNVHVSANISSQGRKSKEEPGFYFQLSPEGINIYGGAYMVEKDSLQNLRSHIAANLKEFAKLYNDKTFKDKFGDIQGEQHKRLPAEFQAIADKEPLIANKQFYFAAKLKASQITKEDLPDVLMKYYKASKKMSDFLKDGLKG